MKKLFYITLCFALAAFFMACNPIEKRDGVGDIVSSMDQVQATVTPITDNGQITNKVMVHCTSPVLCQWTDGVKTYVSTDTVMTLFVAGVNTITLTVRAADGAQFTKDFSVNVALMKYAVAPEFGFFCGSGERTWTWADADCMGNGGGSDQGPAWWKLQPADLAGQFSGKSLPADGVGATMKFTLHGLKLTKTSVGGAVADGKFSFDMTDKKAGWSIGKLSLKNTNILGGYDFNATGYTAWDKYDIISLSNTKMVLGVQEHAPNSNYWYYVFKAL